MTGKEVYELGDISKYLDAKAKSQARGMHMIQVLARSPGSWAKSPMSLGTSPERLRGRG